MTDLAGNLSKLNKKEVTALLARNFPPGVWLGHKSWGDIFNSLKALKLAVTHLLANVAKLWDNLSISPK